MRILDKKEIVKLLEGIDLLRCIEEGFIEYSTGNAVIPPVAGMDFSSPPGEVHIKFGYINSHSEYVVKIASGFYDNPKIGKPSSNGLMLVFSKDTGELTAILHDEGYLTDVRTAVAGAIAARRLAPASVKCIGIVGTGTQAHLQLTHLKTVTDCREVVVYGRRESSCFDFKARMQRIGFNVNICGEVAELAACCNLIVTTTPSREALLMAADIRPGTHITAVGADTPGKQELDARLFARANLVVADSISQCIERGECSAGIREGYLDQTQIVELGHLLAQGGARQTPIDITIADLTGVAVQDIQIATSVYHEYLRNSQ